MKLTFLGTSAGEGYPGFWCTCPNCTYAREHAGRNIRGNSCAMVDTDILLDMNDHFFAMVPRLGIDIGKIRHLLVTHPHVDHFTPWKLSQRAMPYAGLPPKARLKEISPCFTTLPTLHVYGNSFVKQAMEKVPGLMENQTLHQLSFHPVQAGVPFCAGDAEVTPVRSIHGPEKGFAFNYIITRGGKTLFYATDTGGYDGETLALIAAYRYDCVIMEGTFGQGKSVDGHMSLEKNRAMLDHFTKNGLWRNSPGFHLTHLCPHWCPPHDVYAPMLKQEGMVVAYDGKTVEI